MARVQMIAPADASGELAAAYDGIAARRGEVANILRVQSANPRALSAHFELYRTLMFAASPLSRVEREAVAVAVSATNGCKY